MTAQNPVAFGADAQGELVIRVERSHFGDFVRGLLGQPQTIESFFDGPFDLEKNDLVQLHHLLTQRISQQNQGELIQFTATIYWENDSSVLLNSFDDFISYEAVGGDVTTSISLAWTFLIQFHDRGIPEKQTIHWSLDRRYRSSVHEGILPIFSHSIRGCHLRIEHTARTWGMDIENLIGQKMRAWTQKDGWIKSILYKNSGLVGVAAGIIMLGLIAAGLGGAMIHLEKQLIASAAAAHALADSGKLNYLIDFTIASRAMSRPEAYGGTLVIFAIIVSLIVGAIISTLADNPPRGFLVLSDADKISRQAALDQRRKGWAYFIASGVTAVIAGVLSRYIFMAWFGAGT